MNARLAKEIRPFLLPWTLVALAAGLMALAPLVLARPEPPDASLLVTAFRHVVLPVSPTIFFGGVVLLGALSFGTEFQHRTLPLFLGQPVGRSQLWNEKLKVFAGATTAAVLIYFLLRLILAWAGPSTGGAPEPQEILLGLVFLLAVVCSAGFWTLEARSTIGGMTFTWAGMFIAATPVSYMLAKILKPEPDREDLMVTTVFTIAGVIYSAVFLVLGRQRFARFELYDRTQLEFGLSGRAAVALEKWTGWLRCRAGGRGAATANLVRKELRLLHPVFLIAALFSLGWLMSLALLWLLPEHRTAVELGMNLLAGLYVPVVLVLVGCVGLGEERTLGVAPWHLTLPLSTRRQWFMKLLVCGAVAIVLAWMLPFALSWLAAPKSTVGMLLLAQGKDNGVALVASSSLLLFVLAFWAASFQGSAIRGAVTTLVAIVALGLVAALGVWLAAQVGGLQTPVLLWLAVQFQLPPGYFERLLELAPAPVLALVFAPLAFGTLAQSAAMYRRDRIRTRTLAKYCTILGLLVFAPVFWVMDFQQSHAYMEYDAPLVEELCTGLRTVPNPTPAPPAGKGWTISAAELGRIGRFSELTQSWLRNSTVEITPQSAPDAAKHYYQAVVTFPNGRKFTFSFEKPPKAAVGHF